MTTKFKVTTPFGFGVATSLEDLQEFIGHIRELHGDDVKVKIEQEPVKVKTIGGSVDTAEGAGLPSMITDLLEKAFGAERSEAQQEEACDCENCQHNARASEEKLAELTELLASINDLDILRFMEKDAGLHRDASILGKGKDHPQVAHLEKVVSQVQERIAELGNPAQDKDIADPISIIIDKLAGALDKDFTSEVEKISRPASELMSDEEILERLSDDIAHVNKISDLTVLQCFREFMTTVLESDDPNKKREAELLIEKIDEQIARLEGENKPEDAVFDFIEFSKELVLTMSALEIDELLYSIENKLRVMATADPGLQSEKTRLEIERLKELKVSAESRITELTGESDADKVENKTTWGKRNPDLLDLDYVSTTVDIGADMLASIDLGYAVSKEQMTSLVRRSTEILDEYLKSEVELIESDELSREARLDDEPVDDSPTEEPLPTLEAIKAMTDHDEVDKLQIELERKLSLLSDKKQALIDEVHAEMKHIEDLHAAAANQKAIIHDNKADIAHADMADKVKALQEAITRSQPHLIIHDDIREAMEILMERYRK